MIILHVLIILLCCGALWLGATWLVDAAARIAKRLGISELVIGLTVVAFGTSAPEFAVSIQAALQRQPDVAIGNAVGSNVFNVGLILGICALIAVIATRKSLVLRDSITLLLSTAVLLFMLRDRALSRLEGGVLAAGLVGYLIFLFVKREAILDEDIPDEPARWTDVPLLITGLALVVGGGHFLRESAEVIAVAAGLSKWVIAMTVIAACTSIPELAISMIAVIRKRHGISAGNLVGSNIFNTLGVVGVAGALCPKDTPLVVDETGFVSIAALIGIYLFLAIFMWTGKRVNRWEGAILILLSLAVWAYNFAMSRPATT